MERKNRKEESKMDALDPTEQEGFLFEAVTITETVDNRQTRTYGRKVSLAGYFFWEWEGEPWPFENLDRGVGDVFPLDVDMFLYNATRPQEGKRGVSWSLEMPLIEAGKPSLICSEEEAWAAVECTPEGAFALFQEGLIASHRLWKKSQSLKKVAEQATSVRNWIADELWEKAKKASRFMQRRAALTVEVEQEMILAFKEKEEEWKKELLDSPWKEESGEKLDSKAVEVGMKKALEYARQGVRTLGMPRGATYITPEEVE